MGAVVGAALCAGCRSIRCAGGDGNPPQRRCAFDPLVFVMACSPAVSFRLPHSAAPSPASFPGRLRVPEDSAHGHGHRSRQRRAVAPRRPERRTSSSRRALRIVRTAALLSALEAMPALGTAGSERCCRSNPRPDRKDADLFVAVDVGPGSTSERPVDKRDGRSRRRPVPARLPRVVRMHGEAMRIMMRATERTLADCPRMRRAGVCPRRSGA